MDARDPAEAAEILDLLLTYFGEGERWIKGRLSDRRGKCCLVGALDFVSSPAGGASDIIGLAALAGFRGGYFSGAHDGRGQCVVRLAIGMLVAPPIAVRGFALGYAVGRFAACGSHCREPARLRTTRRKTAWIESDTSAAFSYMARYRSIAVSSSAIDTGV